MTTNRFDTLLDQWGPDLERWPASQRREACALLAESATARDSLALARLLAESLVTPVPVSPGLRQRVLDLPLTHPRLTAATGTDWVRGMARLWRQWTAGATSALAVGVLGFFLGYTGQVPDLTDEGLSPAGELIGVTAEVFDLDGQQ
jgi:hypothetical protein